MSRILHCARHCSPAEQCLLKGMRAVCDVTEGLNVAAANFFKLGLNAELAESFIRLIQQIRQDCPRFELLQSSSPFISADELSLLAVLALESKSIPRRADEGPDFQPDIARHLEKCGKIIAVSNIVLKARPLRKRLLKVS
ncbi:hypothetical protein [Pseudomonas sp. RC10]|uniref:hypothetical protein n=1 Tax=Pseudomonas bambusae TaxID=3139142 RepID=UPI0031395F7A